MVWRWSSSLNNEIPAERKERNPLITPEGAGLLNEIINHPGAPLWNYQVGDRVIADDLPEVDNFRRALFGGKPGRGATMETMADWAMRMAKRSTMFMERIPMGFDLEKEWECLPAMGREDIATRIDDIVPLDADLGRLIVYETSGATGHAIDVPQHPLAVAKNHPVLEYIMARHGAGVSFSPGQVACMNVGAEAHTVVFANVFSVWSQAGFAKVNIHPSSWKKEGDAHLFFEAMAPMFLTGDPVAFAEMMKWDIPARPAAMISTAVTLNPGLKAALESKYSCPVIDFYSTTETGPIAFSLPDSEGYEVICPDVYVEALDGDGYPAKEGELGEIAISGGRNPFLPLLRYRTGDYGRVERIMAGGKPAATRIVDLRARKAVSFVSRSGALVHPLDVGRTLRLAAFVQSRMIQRADGSIDLAIRPVPGEGVDRKVIAERLEFLFGAGQVVRIELDEDLGKGLPGGKVIPFESELEQEGESESRPPE